VFALWDARIQQLFCARDQFGVAPFYYATVGGSDSLPKTIVLGNTLDCVRMFPGVSDELNELAIADWLLFRNNQDMTTTTFRAIGRVPPAHTLTCSEGRVQVRRYWALPEHIEPAYRPPADTVARFQHLFERAVQDRLRTDRIVIGLSGGMDSSSVAVTAQRLLTGAGGKHVLRAYTITTDHLMPDRERYYAGLVAAHANIPIQFVPFTLPGAPDLTFTNPPPEPGNIPGEVRNALGHDQAEVSRVSLSGVGGDPLLMPSRTFLFELIRRGKWGNLARVLSQYRQMEGTLPPLYVRSSLKRRTQGARTSPLPRWLNPSFAARLGLAARWSEVTAQIRARDPRRGMAESPFWSNFFSQWDPGYTHKPTKLYYPFFDLRVLTYVLSLPPVPWFVNKTLLREAMRSALPEEVRRRPKTPLRGNLIYQQAQTQPPEWMRELAVTPELEPYVDREALLQIIETPAQTTPREFQNALSTLALAYWLHHVLYSRQPIAPAQSSE
jgi:asparagine synthase (glutamine-hydrolysing)